MNNRTLNTAKRIKFATDASVLREAKRIARLCRRSHYDDITGAFVAGALFQIQETLRRNKGIK